MVGRIGVLALQGDTDAHLAVLDRLGVAAAAVKAPTQLDDIDALILPGGESTTLSMLLESSGLREPVSARLAAGMPAFGTCAGMILLATEVLDGRADQKGFGMVDITVRRNGFGRQIASFETDLDVAGLAGPVRGVFIRAPRVEGVGPAVDVLAEVTIADGTIHPVLCRQDQVMVAAFHPELGDDDRIHRMFLDLVASQEA